MKQMDLPEEMKVPFDYTEEWVPGRVKTLEPTIFKEGNDYCCLLGADPQAGIFGCGDTVKAAVEDWNNHLKAFIVQPSDNDPLQACVMDKLNASVYKIN
jgi:hypothetical protein